MNKQRVYVGLDKDVNGGMTPTGTIIRDAWVFELLDEGDNCTGWNYDRLQALYDRVYAAWAPYGHLVSKLPPELQERHQRIYDAAVRRAREEGWSPEMGLE